MNKHSVSSRIDVGMRVRVRDSLGRAHTKIAVSAPTQGLDGEIVRACRPEEWEEARVAGREPVSVPWPAEDVEADDE